MTGHIHYINYSQNQLQISTMFSRKKGSTMKYKNIRFRMFYVDLTNPATRKQNCSNFSFIIDFSWRSSIPGTLDGGRICWLLSEILFCRPKMNKQKSDLALKKAVSYVMRRMCQPVWFHIHLPVLFNSHACMYCIHTILYQRSWSALNWPYLW